MGGSRRGPLLGVGRRRGAAYSFAGQARQFPCLSRLVDAAAKVAAVWRSGFGERILAYRREHNLKPTPRPPTVLVRVPHGAG